MENENYAKKSAALIIASHLHISEQGAEYIVELLIEAVKHDLRVSAPGTTEYAQAKPGAEERSIPSIVASMVTES